MFVSEPKSQLRPKYGVAFNTDFDVSAWKVQAVDLVTERERFWFFVVTQSTVLELSLRVMTAYSQIMSGSTNDGA
jgi:hypothetical protein